MHIIRVAGRVLPPDCPPVAVALGFFDGVHTGHVALFSETRKEADARGIPAAAFLFAEGESIKPDIPRLGEESDRLARIAAAGIDCAYLFDFDALRGLSPDQFVQDILLDGLHAACVTCGFNFRYGAGGAGNIETLSAALAPHGVPLSVLPPFMVGGETVSSSAIRAALSVGDLARANAMLGYPFSFFGNVIHGQALGRRLGFPTANIALPSSMVVPAHGVYAVTVDREQGKRARGIANIGCRPTVSDGGEINCEVHLFDTDCDLYNTRVRVCFHRYLRGEQKFENIEALARQIAQDKQNAKEYFDERMDQTQRPL